MRSARIEGAAVPLGKPANWDDDQMGHCGTLWVRPDVESGVHFMRSAWDVEAHDAGYLLAGAKVELGIAGSTHPVVNLRLGPLPDTFEPPLTVTRERRTDGEPVVCVRMFFAQGIILARARAMGSGIGSAVADAIDEIERLGREQGWITE